MNDRDIRNAASICYAPQNVRYISPLISLIEELVVPSGVTSYTQSQMEEYIRNALQEKK